MKVLVLTKNWIEPAHDGGALRVRAIARYLSERGHEVRVMAVRDDPSQLSHRSVFSDLLARLCAVITTGSISVARWTTSESLRRLRGISANFQPDIVIVEFAQLARLAAALPLTLPVVFDTQNIESDLVDEYGRSGRNFAVRTLAKLDVRPLRRVERWMASRASVVGFVSERDHSRAVGLGLIGRGTRVIIVQNGFDEGLVRRDVNEGARRGVVFVGNLGWAPNVDAACWLALEVWPLVSRQRPDIELLLIGRGPHARVNALASATVSVIPDVPSVEPFLSEAAVATAPLQAAGGTRLKIVEALAVGTPVVATTLGALGLETLVGEFLRVADDPEKFAREVIELLDNSVSPSGARNLVGRFTWSETLAPLGDLLESGTEFNP